MSPKSPMRLVFGVILAVTLVSAGCGTGVPGLDPNVVVVEVTDRKPPPPEDDGLADDRLADKKTAYDPELVDSRPLEGWLINQSEAVISLDVPLVQPDYEAELLVLHPTYQTAMRGAARKNPLPSVNLLDGKAKQFDDGLYAALDLLQFQGLADRHVGNLDLIERMLGKLPPDSPAAPFLAAAVTLGGRDTPAADAAARQKWIGKFQENPALAKPIGFYTWNDDLKKCWAFMRFLQQSLDPADPAHAPTIAALAAVLADDSQLKADYEQAAGFFGKLTNPLNRLTVADVVGVDLSTPQARKAFAESKGLRSALVAVFPPSTSREYELIMRLFPRGLPPGANLIRELVKAVRTGEVDLTPRENSGWYDHQVYALQTMLLPETGEEHDKLLLTKSYKKRMLEAFAALITKRRETHARQLGVPTAAAPAPPRELDVVQPRLRVEPCPSYYLRTARSYAFLANFLAAALGDEKLAAIHGLRQNGPRELNLAAELAEQRDRFYGLYLVSCEDIGHRPTLRDDEVADREACYQAALTWLSQLADDVDLAEDTRVAVPIYVDPFAGTMRLWVTLGVRLTKLDARFATPPRLKPESGDGDWTLVEKFKLKQVTHLIAVDEFAEVEVRSLQPPNRDELRKLCDRHKTKEAIVAALAAGQW